MYETTCTYFSTLKTSLQNCIVKILASPTITFKKTRLDGKIFAGTASTVPKQAETTCKDCNAQHAQSIQKQLWPILWSLMDFFCMFQETKQIKQPFSFFVFVSFENAFITRFYFMDETPACTKKPIIDRLFETSINCTKLCNRVSSKSCWEIIGA